MLTWGNEVNCNKCERVQCDPEKIELYRSVGRKIWRQAFT